VCKKIQLSFTLKSLILTGFTKKREAAVNIVFLVAKDNPSKNILMGLESQGGFKKLANLIMPKINFEFASIKAIK